MYESMNEQAWFRFGDYNVQVSVNFVIDDHKNEYCVYPKDLDTLTPYHTYPKI